MKHIHVFSIGIESFRNCDFLRQGLSQDGERQVEAVLCHRQVYRLVADVSCPKEIIIFESDRIFH